MGKNIRHAFQHKAGHVFGSLALCLLVSACSSLPKGELSLDLGIKDRGIASWYGKEFHGKPAANGELFDMTAYTAAHRKLPLGSIVRVVNLANGKSTRVRINDRGPYVPGRMLDLSHAAARELDMVEAGTTAVYIEVTGDHHVVAPVPAGRIFAVAGSMLTEDVRPSRPNRVAEGLERPDGPIRMMPPEALYVRRERRIGSILAANHTAHNTVPVLIVS